MKITENMLQLLKTLAEHPENELRGTSIADQTGMHLHYYNAHTVKGLYRRGLIVHVEDRCWAESFNSDGELIHRYMEPVYHLSDEGRRKALDDDTAPRPVVRKEQH